MSERTQWISSRARLGWTLLAVGVLLLAVGIFIQLQFPGLPYNSRIVSGLGILLIGGGGAMALRYQAALKNKDLAKQLNVEERDERTVLIRQKAGFRAYVVSVALVVIGLMWSSFAANQDLPELSGDILWFFLAICFVVPMGVYIASVLIDERNM